MARGHVRRKGTWTFVVCLVMMEGGVSAHVRPPLGSLSSIGACLQPAFAHSEKLGGANLRERARALVNPEKIREATKRRGVQLRAAFSSAVLPLNEKLSPRVKELRDTLREQMVHVKEAVEDVLPHVPHAKAQRARQFANRVRGDDEVHRQLYCAAPLQDIVATCSDLEHYQRWTGTGIKKIEVLRKTRDESVIRYNTGALGLSFDFTLRWKRETAPNTVPFVMTFENVGEKSGLIGSLNGAYIIDRLPNGVSTITFDFSSELASHIPSMVKHALGKMVVDIATQDLKRHTEAEAAKHVRSLPPTDPRIVALADMRSKVDQLEGRRPKGRAPALQPAHA